MRTGGFQRLEQVETIGQEALGVTQKLPPPDAKGGVGGTASRGGGTMGSSGGMASRASMATR